MYYTPLNLRFANTTSNTTLLMPCRNVHLQCPWPLTGLWARNPEKEGLSAPGSKKAESVERSSQSQKASLPFSNFNLLFDIFILFRPQGGTGGWLRENGSISPFRVFRPSLVMFVQFEANLCDEACCGLAGISLVLYVFRLLCSSWNPQNQHLSFSTPKWPSPHSKKITFEGRISNFDANNIKIWGKKRQ